ncbi:MAG: biopolymer transporter ExbD [Bacteroidia bacterium]|nr:biopolymer transporter ExbD [Bacteroidia bacterium]
MSKKPKRGAPAIDMTAMVDVAFLLLTFFILTTTSFREEQKLEVDMPSSHVDSEIPASKMMVISVGPRKGSPAEPTEDDMAIFVSYSDEGTRDKVVRFMEEKLAADYPDLNLKFSEEGKKYFSTVSEFGVPLLQMQKWLNATYDEQKEWPMPGISAKVTDSTKIGDYLYNGNDLQELVFWGRRADPQMRFAIKGDGTVPYPVIYNIISTLQDYNVNTFSLITDMEEGGMVEE